MAHFFVRVLCMKLCVELKGCNLKDVFNVIIDMNNMTAGFFVPSGKCQHYGVCGKSAVRV